MRPDLIYQLALTMVPNIGPVQAKILLQHCEAEEIFHAKQSFLEKIEGIGPVRAGAIKQFHDFHLAEDEIKCMEKYGIRALFLTDEAYPKRLLNCYDSPTLLFYKGETDLNASRMLSIIGTRSHTEYGRQQTEQIVKELAAARVTIVSGLAYGVDALAHKAALRNELPTIGVLAHGLDQVYPPEHNGLVKEMIKKEGGILSEFRCNIKPDKHNFPSRNRIVAGMTDATIIIETGEKGGSMITAELANSYNKDVFALPGKLTDPKSAGCNQLIKTNKAALLTDTQELIELLGWGENTSNKKGRNKQRALFIELSPEERIITEILNVNDPLHIDEINHRSGLSSSAVAGALLNLELQSVVLSLPGKQYKLS